MKNFKQTYEFGMTGFEPATTLSQNTHVAQLRNIPQNVLMEFNNFQDSVVMRLDSSLYEAEITLLSDVHAPLVTTIDVEYNYTTEAYQSVLNDSWDSDTLNNNLTKPLVDENAEWFEEYVKKARTQSAFDISAQIQTQVQYELQSECDLCTYFDVTSFNENEVYFLAHREETAAFLNEYCPNSTENFQNSSARIRSSTPLRKSSGWSLSSSGGYSGGNTGDGDDSGNGGFNADGDDPGFNFIGIILLGGAGIIIGKIILNYGYKIVIYGYSGLKQRFLKKAENIKNPHYGQQRIFAVFRSAVPALISGTVVVVLAYVINPQHFHQLVEALEGVFILIARQLGRLLLQLIPPQLHQLANQIGHFIENFGEYVRQFVNQVVVPVLLYGRQLIIFGASLYFLFQLASLGIELSKFLQFKVPTAAVTQAKDLTVSLSGSGASIELFVLNYLKSVSLLVVALIPLPKTMFPLPSSKGVLKVVRFCGTVCIVCFVVKDPYQYIKQLAQFLLSYPLVLNLCSCIGGRWGIILITANIARSDMTLKKYSVPFGVLLYFLRVYQLAMIATPNLLP